MNEILECKENYGRLPPCHRTILLEFVSANPTGPLHIGHGRAAAYGDSLANILAFAGYRVLREYYVNDHGRQADILAASVWLRHALDDAEQMPKGGYRGQYLVKVAQAVNPDNFSAKHADSKILLTQLAEKSMRTKRLTLWLRRQEILFLIPNGLLNFPEASVNGC